MFVACSVGSMSAYTGRMSRSVRLIDFRTRCSFKETKFKCESLLSTLLTLKTVVHQASKGHENVLSFKVIKTEHSFLGYHVPRWLNIPDRKRLYVRLFKKQTGV